LQKKKYEKGNTREEEEIDRVRRRDKEKDFYFLQEVTHSLLIDTILTP
jgi:hypothetical protein